MTIHTLHAVEAAARWLPALIRLRALVSLDRTAVAALEQAIARATTVKPRHELLVEGREVPCAYLIVSGWAARVRILVDGRRQFLSFLLPGDLIGMCHQPHPLAVSTVVALTELKVCVPPPPDLSPSLAHAYATSQALEEAYLLANITRLGRLNAQERIADLLLEFNERLTLSGLASNGHFEVPLTQEMLGDALGLTAVHINRMLQLARYDRDLIWREKQVTLVDPATLARKIGRPPIRVSALQG